MRIPASWAYWLTIAFVVWFLWKAGFLQKKTVQPIDIGLFSYQDSDVLLSREYN